MDTTSITGSIRNLLAPNQQSQPSQSAPVQTTNSNGLDPDAVNLAKAIRQTESGGNFQAQGKSGEYGAYQYLPSTWATDSQKYLGQAVPLQSATPEQQNEVAYKKIKDLKDQGNNVGQIASIWNSGSPDWQGKVGTNQYGVAYDTPAYVDKVAHTYQQIKSSSSPSNTGYAGAGQTTQDDSTLGSELHGRFNDAGNAINSIINGESTGNSRASGILQLAGAGAGVIGDVVNKGIELIPGVKPVENLIGKGIGSLAQTSSGQAIVSSLQKFGNEHPELTKDLGAAFNIATAIPILKGLGTIGDVTLDGASSVLKNKAEKVFADESASVIGKSPTGSEFLRRNPTIAKDMIDERLIPDINGRVYDTTKSMNQSDQLLKDLNSQIQSHLNDPKYTTVAEDPEPIIKNVLNGYKDKNGNIVKGLSNSEYTPTEILDTGRELTPQNGKLWTRFEAGQASMADINKLRSDLDQAVQSVYTSTNLPPVKKDIGATLSGAMRDFVQSNATETQEPFARMTKIYKVQKGLKFMDTKQVKPGLLGEFIKTATSGVPILERGGDYAAKKSAGLTTGILNRTGENATRVGLDTLKNKTGGLLKGAFAQKAEKSI